MLKPLLGLGIFMLANIGSAAPACNYKLLAFVLNGQRTYGLAADPSEQIPRSAVRIDRKLGIAGNIESEKLLSKATAKSLCAFQTEYSQHPAAYASELVSLQNQDILPPLPQPKNVFAVGLNYAVHNEEVGVKKLVLFPKNTELTGAYAPIRRPNGALLDWEVELGIVFRQAISPQTKVNAQNISDYVAGFLVLNDVTDRIPIILDIEHGFSRGKTYPTFLPAGPYFVPIEAYGENRQINPELNLRLTVNGLEKQNENSRGLLHSILEIIPKIFQDGGQIWANASGENTALLRTPEIQAGDFVSTGTPGGTAIIAPNLGQKIGLGLKALLRRQKPRWVFINEEYCSGKYLREGDLVSAEIEGLGKQANPIVESNGTEPAVSCDHQQELAKFLSRNSKPLAE